MLKEQKIYDEEGFPVRVEKPFPTNLQHMRDQVCVKHLMTTHLVTVAPNDNGNEVNSLFEQYLIHHIPVVEQSGEFLGLISKSDFFNISIIGFFNIKSDINFVIKNFFIYRCINRSIFFV